MLPLSLAKKYIRLLEMGMNSCPCSGSGVYRAPEVKCECFAPCLLPIPRGDRDPKERGTALGLTGLNASEMQQARCRASLGLLKVAEAQASGTSAGKDEQERGGTPTPHGSSLTGE